MINIPTKLLKEVQDGLKTQKDIEAYLLENHTISDILSAFAELLILSEDYINRQQIAVTQEEYDAIMGLFRIKGLRTLDGMVVQETRGRKPKLLSNK